MSLSDRVARRIRLWHIDSWSRRMEFALKNKDWSSLEYCRRTRTALVRDARQRGWIP